MLKLDLRTCDQCKKLLKRKANGNMEMATIVERDPVTGKYTGRVLHLCGNCEYLFYKLEIKRLNQNLDIKSHLEKWNKAKL